MADEFNLTSRPVTTAEALESADELERVVGEIANGRRKASRIPLEPIARLVQFVRDASPAATAVPEDVERLANEASNAAHAMVMYHDTSDLATYCERMEAAVQRLAALAARAAPASTGAVPAGWKLVPDSVTHNMLNAANAGRKKGRSSSGDIYRAMLDAAPSSPAAAPLAGEDARP